MVSNAVDSSPLDLCTLNPFQLTERPSVWSIFAVDGGDDAFPPRLGVS